MIGFTSGKHRVIYKIHFFPGSVLFLLLLVEKKNGTLHILKVWPPKRASPPTPRFTKHRIIYKTHFFSGSVLFLLLFVEKKNGTLHILKVRPPKRASPPTPRFTGLVDQVHYKLFHLASLFVPGRLARTSVARTSPRSHCWTCTRPS